MSFSHNHHHNHHYNHHHSHHHNHHHNARKVDTDEKPVFFLDPNDDLTRQMWSVSDLDHHQVDSSNDMAQQDKHSKTGKSKSGWKTSKLKLDEGLSERKTFDIPRTANEEHRIKSRQDQQQQQQQPQQKIQAIKSRRRLDLFADEIQQAGKSLKSSTFTHIPSSTTLITPFTFTTAVSLGVRASNGDGSTTAFSNSINDATNHSLELERNQAKLPNKLEEKERQHEEQGQQQVEQQRRSINVVHVIFCGVFLLVLFFIVFGSFAGGSSEEGGPVGGGGG